MTRVGRWSGYAIPVVFRVFFVIQVSASSSYRPDPPSPRWLLTCNVIPQSRCQVRSSARAHQRLSLISIVGAVPCFLDAPWRDPIPVSDKCQKRSLMHSRGTRHTNRCAGHTLTRELQCYSPPWLEACRYLASLRVCLSDPPPSRTLHEA